MTQLLRLGLAAMVGVVAFGVLGCSHKSDETSVVNEPAGANTKVVFIPKSTGNAYFDEVVNGFTVEAGKVNVDFSTAAPADANATSQIPYIQQQVQKGVDVIAISPNSPDALNQALDAAKAKGVIVITVDADLANNESHRVAAVLPADASTIGMGQLDTLASLLPNGGDFAILSAAHDAPNQNAWIDVMKKALADPKYAKLRLVDIVYGDDDPAKSTTEAEALFAKHPNLRGIISPTSVGLAAAAGALQTAGLYPGGPHASAGGGIVLTGLSTPKQMKKYVDQGVVTKFQLWSPRSMGLLACYLAAQLKHGKVKPDEGTEVDVPSIGKVKFGAKGVITAGPMITFDKSNIGMYNF